MTIRALSHDLLAQLSPACERAEIKGSIVRGKPNPKDIEIVCIPIWLARMETDLFGSVLSGRESRLDTQLDFLFQRAEWELDRKVKRNGEKYKRLAHVETGIACDLFITTPECWGAIATIRTGPGGYSRMLVTRALHMGMQVEHGILYRVHRDGRRDTIDTPTEEDFFHALGLAWIMPEARR